MRPKGTILIIGGHEDKGDGKRAMGKSSEYEKFELLKDLLPEHGGNKRIELITTASAVPEDIKRMYIRAFAKIGFKNTGFMDIEDKLHAKDISISRRVEKAHAVFFTGGDQFKLSGILGGTQTIRT